MEITTIAIIASIALAVALFVFIPVFLRVVVPTNEVHIVQTSKSTVSYGKEHGNNTYYKWPSWIPRIGVVRTILPVHVFSIDLQDYAAYDKGRVPFVIDIKAFFRISNSDIAAQRVGTTSGLVSQLEAILQGAARTILASSEIEEIMEGRGKFGEMFTKEVDEQLKNWGVTSVKQIELMDIRDAKGSMVIANIMEKKKSLIEMESRAAVAENNKKAEIAEVTAKQEADLKRQEALQIVGIRTAEKDKEVGIANEQSKQEIMSQAKVTIAREMDVKAVEQVRAADIAKDVAVVQAKQEQEVKVVNAEAEKKALIVGAEGTKESTVITANGNLEASKLNAQGIEAIGTAEGAAERAKLMAPVDTQITLAKEIGQNKSYQEYLVQIREIEAKQAVGIEQAGALKAANIKVIANSGDVVGGVNNVMDLFSSKGGTSAGAALEAFANTEAGASLLKKFGITVEAAKQMMENHQTA